MQEKYVGLCLLLSCFFCDGLLCFVIFMYFASRKMYFENSKIVCLNMLGRNSSKYSVDTKH